MGTAEILDRVRQAALESRADDDACEPYVVELLQCYVLHRPHDAFAWYVLGDSLRVLGRARQARAALLRALSLAPAERKYVIQIRLAMLHQDRGCQAIAERWFALASRDEATADLGWFWIFRGANLALAEAFEEAEQCHRRASQLPGDPDEAFLNLGYVLRAQRKYADAEAAFEQALDLTPDYPEAEKALAGLRQLPSAFSLIEPLAAHPITRLNGRV